MINRIFVEKRKGFDIRKDKLTEEIKTVLGISLKMRLFLLYDVECDREDFLNSINTVFCCPSLDKTYFKLPKLDNAKVLCVSYLKGQYDQRADSASQCMQMLTQKEPFSVKCATIYAFFDIDDEQFTKIKKYIINPIESEEISLDKPKTLRESSVAVEKEKKVEGFINFNENQLEDFYKKNSFAFSFKDLLHIQDYFKRENRNPYEAELKVLDTYWSDHCRHTTFNTLLDKIDNNSEIKEIEQALNECQQLFKKYNKYPSLMNIAIIGAKELRQTGYLKNLDLSEEINACSIKIKADIDGEQQDYTIMFKNETHNHPTEIEPFGGAATCLGGAIRDPLSGRSYVYQAMRVSGAGNILSPLDETIKGKLPQRVIAKQSASGFSSYGNQIGLATGLVREFYHEGYTAKRLETGFVVAGAKSDNIVRENPIKGDIVLLIGGRTGRDGLGGATGSSKAHKEDSLYLCGAEVQKGNPITERKLLRLFRNGEFSKLIKRCNDFGAGGVSVAVGELADSLDINLDNVPKKYLGLTGLETAISESQERMAVVIDKANLDKIKSLCKMENLEVSEIASVTDSNRLRMFFNGELIVDIDRKFLDTNGVSQKSSATIGDKIPQYFYELTDEQNNLKREKKYEQLIINLLSDINTACQKGLVEMFDSTIGASTVLMPFGGRNQLSPSISMVAKIPVDKQTSTATVCSYGFNPYLSEQSPFIGAMYAVTLSVIKTLISGADYDSIYLTLQEFFERLNNDKEKWGKPVSALLGALYAQLRLKIGAIGGKDSMSGTFLDINVPPTLISFSLGVARAENVIHSTLSPNLSVYRYKIKRNDSGVIDFESLTEFLHQYEKQRKEIKFASIIEEGGLICCLTKALLGNDTGFKFDPLVKEEDLFNNLLGDIVFALEKGKHNEIEKLCEYLGETNDSPNIELFNKRIKLENLKQAYLSPLKNIYPIDAKAKDKAINQVYRNGSLITRAKAIAKPKVFIPIFPGTNCEYDSIKAFEREGAIVSTTVLRNLSPLDIDESVKEIARQIDCSNILFLSGGFSGGDEPDGSGKFIASTLISPYILESINNLLYKRDGLILGICNGFQALVKLGLLPYGKIGNIDKDSPTLSFNKISRHISQIVSVSVCSNLSPWLSLVKPNETYLQPVSHGEGRFILNDDHLQRMVKSGQIATQYVDFLNRPTMKTPFNPNGSMNAIEGITSPDGRILGKMGHSERIGKNLMKNIDGETDLKLFKAGVKYFS